MQTRTFAFVALATLLCVGIPAASADEAGAAAQTGAASPTPLAQAVAARPFREFGTWWPVGDRFSTFMADAIVSQWSALTGNDKSLAPVEATVADYVRTVYGRQARASLVADFVARRFATPIQSGEFDALSYAFFKSAFDLIERHIDPYGQPLPAERRLFTRRVGKAFFTRVQDHLHLSLPARLDDEASLAQLKEALRRLGAFLKDEGYVRDHFAFRLEVDAARSGGKVAQPEAAFLDRLRQGQPAYALYEMGYPVILPSAVYLYGTVGEAQHHSSRTIEELFGRVGCDARESDDFDPRGYPSDMVVELWKISRR